MTTHSAPTVAPLQTKRRPSAKAVWPVERIRALGAATDLPTAASILGISRSQAYRLAATDAFPAPVIRAGTRIIVPVAGLLRLLLADDGDPIAAPHRLRLDQPAEASVDATSIHPADYTRRRWRARVRHSGDDE